SQENESPNGSLFRRKNQAASRQVTPGRRSQTAATEPSPKGKQRKGDTRDTKNCSRTRDIYRHLERYISRSSNMRARVERKTDETFRQELEKLYREKYPEIYRAAYGITAKHQDAEDALQNVFLKLFGRPPSSGFNKDPEAYLCRAAMNEAV